MRLSVGSDHMGYGLKTRILPLLRADGHEVIDWGSHDETPVDFPDIAKEVCRAILQGRCERGIMFCGTGVGAAIACNKTGGIRASVCHDLYTAHQCVEHDNVQVIALGGQIVGDTVAYELISRFLQAEFSKDTEFRRRVAKLERLDQERKGV